MIALHTNRLCQPIGVLYLALAPSHSHNQCVSNEIAPLLAKTVVSGRYVAVLSLVLFLNEGPGPCLRRLASSA